MFEDEWDGIMPNSVIAAWWPDWTSDEKEQYIEASSKKWPKVHDAMWKQLCVPSSDFQDAKKEIEHKFFFRRLPMRQKDVVLMKTFQVPDTDQEQVWEISQVATRITMARGKSTCILPKGRMWLRHLERPLAGVEALALQGADISKLRALRPTVWSGSFLQDLAGNAFCTSQFQACFTSALASM